MADKQELPKFQPYLYPDPFTLYCIDHSYKLHPAQVKLYEATRKHSDDYMAASVGPKDVMQICTCFIKLIGGKNVLDLGTFTGFSALTWALAIPQDGRVITVDITDQHYQIYGKKIIEEAGMSHKIELRIQPALQALNELIASGQSGKFDFIFIDAAKTEYPEYYEKSLQLVRSGGIIAVDDGLWDGIVVNLPDDDEDAKSIDQLNKIILNDDRVFNFMLPIGDGLHLAFKK